MKIGMKNKIITRYLVQLLTLVFLGFIVGACSKPALYGTIQNSDDIVRYYQAAPEETFRAVKSSLEFHGYSLKKVDEENRSLETYWQPTTADSHYVEVFGRPDFGTVGAYYRFQIKVEAWNKGSKVVLVNVANSIISNLKTSKREEDRIFTKIDDFTRHRDIQVTNIGLQ
ncbi:MAG: hypothetical protein H7A32_00915 [Deltaproteobacteria bacterium]|nr:hypothetical protein [Deltaproteobacteria bacterium]